VFSRGKVKINICKDGVRTYPEDKFNHCGIDVNVKHNLFTLSDGKDFDYNRSLINNVCKELLKVDELKSKSNDYVIGKKRQRKIEVIRDKITKSNQALCVEVCKHLNKSGLDHVVFENLNNSFGKSFVKQEGINFNRITKELRLSSLKDMFTHISQKYDIAVSYIHPEYTSKQCSSCGCIEDANRLNQEDFKCVECNYTNNADVNAAINIKQRVSEAVLRDKLLKQTKLDNGTYEPKILKRDVVKNILLSCR
jgi:IS605 OrfB family transposase